MRARLFNRRQITRSKNRITGILRVAGCHFTETETGWTKAHRAWMAKLRRELTGPMQTVLASELQLLEYLEASISSLEAAITEVSVQSPWREPVEALCCFRGVKTLTAMTIVSEIGDIKRFGSPRQLMSYVGLVPSERSSGERSHRGPITKAGNSHLRRVLIESSQPCRRRAASTLILRRRRAGQNSTYVGIALKAQHRLERRYAHLALTKHTNKAITAVAREFCGFVWAMLWEVQGRH